MSVGRSLPERNVLNTQQFDMANPLVDLLSANLLLMPSQKSKFLKKKFSSLSVTHVMKSLSFTDNLSLKALNLLIRLLFLLIIMSLVFSISENINNNHIYT